MRFKIANLRLPIVGILVLFACIGCQSLPPDSADIVWTTQPDIEQSAKVIQENRAKLLTHPISNSSGIIAPAPRFDFIFIYTTPITNALLQESQDMFNWVTVTNYWASTNADDTIWWNVQSDPSDREEFYRIVGDAFTN